MCAFVHICALVCLGVLYICDVDVCACMYVFVYVDMCTFV